MSLLYPTISEDPKIKIEHKQIKRRVKARFKQLKIENYKIHIHDFAEMRTIRIFQNGTECTIQSTLWDNDLEAFNKKFPRK